VPLVLHHRKSRPDPGPASHPRVAVVEDAPSVTAIVPTRNQLLLLRNCIEGLSRTEYPKLDVLVVDNGSDEEEVLRYLRSLEQRGIRVVSSPGPFNYSALNNAAVDGIRTDYLCFLNNDVEMLDSSWLTQLIVHAMRSDIGAVGGRLLYPDRTIQHAGVFIGVGGGAGHAHRFQSVEESGYFERANLPQRVSAVTGACMVVAREKFLAVGGFDEVDFPVAFNDVDLCLKLNARGWQSFYEPSATLVHHESKSRGNDRAKANRTRFEGELAALKRKWGTDRERDPYHHPHLSPFCEQFVIAV
jgi:GT2 family glycosyltransferase